MSTKVTIGWRASTPTEPGFHLYWDSLDCVASEASSSEAPIYLQVEGVGVDLQVLARDCASVTIALPRELARRLGLLAGYAGYDADAPAAQASLFGEVSGAEGAT